MPIGNHSTRPHQRGYTFLGLIFVLALGAVLLLRVADAHQLQSQREREKELLFRGEALSRAIDEYARSSPAGRPRWPTRLEDLLLDQRSRVALRHLRQVYADPFTGRSDWELIPAADEPGGFWGVKSRAQVLALQRRVPVDPGKRDGSVRSDDRQCVCDWAFVASRAGAVKLRD